MYTVACPTNTCEVQFNVLQCRTVQYDVIQCNLCYKLKYFLLFLVDCGVQHTHSNTSRIGTSRAEKEMTSRAMKEVFELGQFSQQPANCFVAIEVSIGPLSKI